MRCECTITFYIAEYIHMPEPKQDSMGSSHILKQDTIIPYANVLHSKFEINTSKFAPYLLYVNIVYGIFGMLMCKIKLHFVSLF